MRQGRGRSPGFHSPRREAGEHCAQGEPNILIIWGDDIGWFNLSAYNHGIMRAMSGSICPAARRSAGAPGVRPVTERTIR
jgi:hypothetical protein